MTRFVYGMALGVVGGIALGVFVLAPRMANVPEDVTVAPATAATGAPISWDEGNNYVFGREMTDTHNWPGHPIQFDIASVEPQLVFSPGEIASSCIAVTYMGDTDPKPVYSISARINLTDAARQKLKAYLLPRDGQLQMFRFYGTTLNSFVVSSAKVSDFPDGDQYRYGGKYRDPYADLEFSIPQPDLVNAFGWLHIMTGHQSIVACEDHHNLEDIPGFADARKTALEYYQDWKIWLETPDP